MRRMLICAMLIAWAVSMPVASVWPQSSNTPETVNKTEEKKEEPAEDENSKEDENAGKFIIEGESVTHHSVVIGGKKIDYVATAGRMILKKEDGKEKANVFFVAYMRDGVEDLGSRPITFSFNGGPGSASVWLHLGVMGPRRVRLDDEGFNDGPPYELIDNEYSPLDITDIVMIDPVSTGYSRPTKDENKEQFHGYSEDIDSVGEFIWSYITDNKRWSSPKFLLGESYGTTRAAGLAGSLQEKYGMYLNGITLVSVVLNFQTLRFGTGNDLPYILFWPSYTATAWYHKKLSEDLQEDLQKALREAEEFAGNEYTLALMKDASLPEADRERVIKKLARLTGLSEKFVEQSNMRIGMGPFAKELLRDQQRTTGRIDSRFKGIDRTPAGESYDYDASMANLAGPFSAMINYYLREELGFESDLEYDVSGNVRPWNYSDFQNRYVNAAETLRGAMTRNQALKIFVTNGYYDLATPYFATEYTFNHLSLDPSLRGNITMSYYEAGHMMYIHKESLIKLKADLVKFYESAQ